MVVIHLMFIAFLGKSLLFYVICIFHTLPYDPVNSLKCVVFLLPQVLPSCTLFLSITFLLKVQFLVSKSHFQCHFLQGAFSAPLRSVRRAQGSLHIVDRMASKELLNNVSVSTGRLPSTLLTDEFPVPGT